MSVWDEGPDAVTGQKLGKYEVGDACPPAPPAQKPPPRKKGRGMKRGCAAPKP